VELQRRILGLRDRGILLAAASKNNAEDVEAVLASHPSCLLKREHFAAFEVHWEDKATSLRRIAHALNIGLDAMVLLDDSPVERAWVSDQVPGVAVLDLPDSPMGFWNAIEDSGCFDALTLTSEDKARAGMYALEGKRQSLRGAAATLEEFLGSLELVLTAGKVDQDTLTRVTQLLGKTNQFNLTTRRHDEAAVRSLCESGTGLWVKVRDRFGDSGLVGVVIAVPEDGQSWRIDTLLLSCRVIGRRVETAMLSLLEHAAAARGVRRLIAEFVPTAKNRPAASFLPDHGFIRNGDFWELELDAPRPLPDCFTVEDLTGSLSPARSA
jgi:FkbH-like protein